MFGISPFNFLKYSLSIFMDLDLFCTLVEAGQQLNLETPSISCLIEAITSPVPIPEPELPPMGTTGATHHLGTTNWLPKVH